MRNPEGKTKKKSSKIILTIVLILILGLGAFAAKVYFDVNNAANTMYESKGNVKNKRGSGKVKLDGKKPFSILLLGTDTGELGRTYKGRTDTMIYVTVNPKTKQTNMLSLARDSRVNISGKNTIAKINAAYAYGGVPMAINTVQDFLDVPVDHYALVNMKGVEEMVDSVGGVSVDNDLDFTFGGVHFPVGKVQLDGEKALKYSRMRHEDPQGDFGRQLRQQAIIKAVIQKSMSLDTVTHYNDFLEALGDNVRTDLKVKDVLAIRNNYGKSMKKIKSAQLRGHGEMIDGQSFQVMDSSELNGTKSTLKEQLELKQ